jgi:hypothetical protein
MIMNFNKVEEENEEVIYDDDEDFANFLKVHKQAIQNMEDKK